MHTDATGTPATASSHRSGPPAPRAAADPDGSAGVLRPVAPQPRRQEPQHVRLHVDTGQPPRLRQLAGMSGWAAALTFGGLIVAIRAVLGIVGGEAPGWYQPTIVIVGLIGILLAASAFVLAQMPKIVWIALSLSTAVLLLGVILTAAAM